MNKSMQYQNNKFKIISFLLTCAISINIIESIIPSIPFLPWIKPGLANSFTLCAIMLFGLKQGLTIAILRPLISGIMIGVPFTSILMGGSGGITSALLMYLVSMIMKKTKVISPLGISILGALTHNITQLFIANILFIKNNFIYWQLPIMGPFSVITGTVTGIIAIKTCNVLNKINITTEYNNSDNFEIQTKKGIFINLILYMFLIPTLFLFKNIITHLIIMFICFLISTMSKPNRSLILLKKFIPFVLMIFLINLFTLHGRIIEIFPFATYQGLNKGAFLSLRFINIIMISSLLINHKKLILILILLKKKLPIFSQSIQIGIYSILNISKATEVFKKIDLDLKNKTLKEKFFFISNNFENVITWIISN